MSYSLTAPFINENAEFTKTFLQSMPKATEMRIKSRAFPQLDRTAVTTGLLRHIQPVAFDPANAEHRRAWAIYFTKGRWITRFYLELPWDNVPQMVQAKMNAYMSNGILHEAPADVHIDCLGVIDASKLL